ncbi:MAG: AEC family transporter [bacterium]|nr:MAG: AEC family transporter [bacterium]
MENLIFTFNVVAPVFLIIFLGFFLKIKGFINNNFILISSKIVFNVTVPALVFIKLSTTDFRVTFDLKQIIFVYVGIVSFFACSWLFSLVLSKDGKDQASFIQGSVRSNFAIIGFALISNTFGNHALGKAAILLAFIMPLYNVLAVIALTVPVKDEKQLSYKKTLVKIITNPLILATFIAIPFSYFEIAVPQFLMVTVDYLATLTLPLALLGIGGSLNFESIKKDSKLAFGATLIKIIFIPAILTYIAVLLGYTQEDLGILFMLFAAPTAIVSFIMAEAMGCNSDLAGNIIVMTTLGSIFTLSLGIFIMKSVGLF